MFRVSFCYYSTLGCLLDLLYRTPKMALPPLLSSHRRGTLGKTTLAKQPILTFLLIAVSFYGGLLIGLHFGNIGDCHRTHDRIDSDITKDPLFESLVNKRVETAVKSFSHQHDGAKNDRSVRFDGMSKFALGAVRTNKKEFIGLYDNGYPADESKAVEKGTENVLILYNRHSAFPDSDGIADAAIYDDGNGIPLASSAQHATENCDALHIVSTKTLTGQLNQCFAIVDEYPSFHVRTWMRINNDVHDEPFSHDLPLVPVSRGKQTNGADKFEPPKKRHIDMNWELLRKYLASVEDMTDKLKPILKNLAINNAVVVMVCNLGQADLLANFVCSAKAKGLETSNILVFATDKETRSVATALGLASFHDEKMFENMPTSEAKHYGDKAFTSMMYAKVLGVQLVNMLGYDVLFQDVDIVWYKSPLESFHDKDSPLYDFDILFQDDGARSIRYAPFSANTGFYYVRYNDRTRYLMTCLLYSGDLVMKTFSHQQAMSALLAEHSSLYNLRVKTMKGEDFPGGYHYHKKNTELMHRIVEGKQDPFLFHMSWTDNKDNKLKYLKQMGLWFVAPKCEGEGVYDESKKTEISALYQASCCSAEPLFTCFYKDKPSVGPCYDSPNIDKKGKSFWK